MIDMIQGGTKHHLKYMKERIKNWWKKLFSTEQIVEETLNEEFGESIDLIPAPATPDIEILPEENYEQVDIPNDEGLVTLDKVPPELVIFYRLNLHELSKSLTFSELANDYIMDYIHNAGYETKYLECVRIKGVSYVIAATKQPQNVKVMLLLYSLYSFIKGGSDEILQYLIHTEMVDKQKIFIFRD